MFMLKECSFDILDKPIVQRYNKKRAYKCRNTNSFLEIYQNTILIQIDKEKIM